MPQPVLALDIGGTKLAAALVDAGGRVLREVTRPTPATDENALGAAVSAVLSEARAGVVVAAVGIGCGGPLDVPAGSVSPVNIPAWRDFPLPRLVGELVPGVPVALANDAVCMALGEQRHGAARHARLEFLRGLRVVPAALGPQAGLVGAACLANDAAQT